MFILTKRMEIAGAHKLDLPYESPCQRLHGHNWVIEVEVIAEELNECGMVIDFTCIKEVVSRLDHQNLNEILEDNPTAENIAKWVVDELNSRRDADKRQVDIQVTVQETEGNKVCYIP